MKIKISPEFRKTARDWIVSQLKGQFIKIVLKSILGASTGFSAWVVSFIAEEAYEEVGQPYIEKWLRGAGYRVDKHNGKILVKALEEATNVEERDDAVDDILG